MMQANSPVARDLEVPTVFLATARGHVVNGAPKPVQALVLLVAYTRFAEHCDLS